jgi:hypothetical protein
MSQRLLQHQKQRLIRSKHPREETSNVAFDLQINPALLKGRGLFMNHLFRHGASAYSSHRYFKLFSLDMLCINTVKLKAVFYDRYEKV